ncbi:MAG: excinuclease ABC subunit UvrA, partial [Bacilli bacterium]
KCNYSLTELEPRLFSFNAPYGACPECKGLGTKLKISEELLIPDKNKSIIDGAITALSMDSTTYYTQIETVCKFYKIDMNKPIKSIPKVKLDYLLYGSDELFSFNYVSKNGNTRNTTSTYEGVIKSLERRYIETKSSWIREWLDGYMIEMECPVCHGKRLQDSVLAIYINNKNIFDMTDMSISDLYDFVCNLKLTNEEKGISDLILKEIKS